MTKLKITIICKIHGEFKQTPNDHLSGKGCKLCAIEKVSNFHRGNLNDFIIDGNLIHRYKYDYSKVIYKTARDKVCIICPEHESFEMSR